MPGYSRGCVEIVVDADMNTVWTSGERRDRRDSGMVISRFMKGFAFDGGLAGMGGTRHYISNGLILLLIPKVGGGDGRCGFACGCGCDARGVETVTATATAERGREGVGASGEKDAAEEAGGGPRPLLDGDELAVALAISEIGRKLSQNEGWTSGTSLPSRGSRVPERIRAE